MAKERAASAANVRSLHDDGRDIKSLLDRVRWEMALRDALRADGGPERLVGHLRPRDRPSRPVVQALAAAVMMRAADGRGLCVASVSTLAHDIGSSPSTVRVCLRVMERGGWLLGRRRWRSSGDPDSTAYRLTIPSPESGGGTPESGAPSAGVPYGGTPESGDKRDSERESLKGSARAQEGATPVGRALLWHGTLSERDRRLLLERHHVLRRDHPTWGGDRHPGLWHAIWLAEGQPIPN